MSDTSKSAYRRCAKNGLWITRSPYVTDYVGWTNYTPCFPSAVKTLFNKVYVDETRVQAKFETAQRTRYMEIAGFSISLVALIISLCIFSYYRSLRNNRTRIHKNLFSAMVMQVMIRLVVYLDQAFIRSSVDESSIHITLRGIDNMPYICEASYVLLEYGISAMFMWMFIEGLYLHNFVTGRALRECNYYLVYFTTGWGMPVILTTVWVAATLLFYDQDQIKACWYGYNFSKLYWILQGPRLSVIMINLVFLLNIMRVLIMKLRRSENSEVEKVRKGAKAALVLLPLLGITNALNMIEGPLEGNLWVFSIWSYSTHFLRSFQGFFIALIYCFLNGEVRQVIRKHYKNYMVMRKDLRPSVPRNNSFMNCSSSSDENKAASKKNKNKKEENIPMTTLSKTSDNNEADPEIAASSGHGNGT